MGVLQNSVTNEIVPFKEKNSIQLVLGLGVQWQFAKHWFTRSEWDAYDENASVVGSAISYLFGKKKHYELKSVVESKPIEAASD